MNTLYDTQTINVIVGMISMAICWLGAIYVWAGAGVDRMLDRIYLKAAGMMILFGVFGILRQVFRIAKKQISRTYAFPKVRYTEGFPPGRHRD